MVAYLQQDLVTAKPAVRTHTCVLRQSHMLVVLMAWRVDMETAIQQAFLVSP
jgi:hypothetical protein